MGSYKIKIHATGQHHNGGHENDADVMAREFAAKLSAAGHGVRTAVIKINDDEAEDLLGDPLEQSPESKEDKIAAARVSELFGRVGTLETANVNLEERVRELEETVAALSVIANNPADIPPAVITPPTTTPATPPTS